MKGSKLGIQNHFGPLWWGKMGESVKQSKLGIQNHFGGKCETIKIQHSKSFWPPLVKKDWKSVECPKLGILNYFGPLWFDKMGKVQNYQNWVFRIILHRFGEKKLEKVQNDQNWVFQIISDHFGGKRLEKVQNVQNWEF